MALVEIGTRNLDFDSRAPVSFPAFDVKSGEAYALFLEALPIDELVTNGYANVLAFIETSYGRVETPLIAKFFPKGAMMMFFVHFPELKWDKDASCEVAIIPREFYRGTAEPRSITVKLSIEDDETFKAQPEK